MSSSPTPSPTPSDQDVVLVEHEDAPKLVSEDEGAAAAGSNKKSVTISPDAPLPVDASPKPLQIVSIGSEDDAYAFTFHEERLNQIISRIPPGWKVSIVSVVGAFRTGKSFILSWFLKYLHHMNWDDADADTSKKPRQDDGNNPWYRKVDALGHDSGFDWRGGSERNTTGIWMWSQPHFVTREVQITPRTRKTERMAVLLVDSQGMFDNETTMSLTASIFGLSTLLSSYQVYNVDKRVQEDNLQQLALFSEYARMAVDADESNPMEKEIDKSKSKIVSNEDDEGKNSEEKPVVEQDVTKPNNDDGGDEKKKPFQKIEFLVRDWQHFDDEEDEDDHEALEKSMETYLEKVLGGRDAKDLQETRDQILACFEEITCYGLCHPGMQVVKKKYNGDVDKIDPMFLALLDRYCKRVFDVSNLEPKTIQGRQVTAAELGAYVKAYAEMFSSGAKFPEASTMLEATASANNTNAINIGLNEYKNTMTRMAGPACSNYVNPGELEDGHRRLLARSLQKFDSMATFGSRKNIHTAREKMVQQIDQDFEMYNSLNQSRNPLAGIETYIFPLTIAFAAFVLRWIADATCTPYSSVCKSGSDFLSLVYGVVMSFLIILAATKAQQVAQVLKRAKSALELLLTGTNNSDGGVGGAQNKTKTD